MSRLTIGQINNLLVAEGKAPIGPDRPCDPPNKDIATIHFLEDAIDSFERSPKKRGNRDHFHMLLSLHLPANIAKELAYGG